MKLMLKILAAGAVIAAMVFLFLTMGFANSYLMGEYSFSTIERIIWFIAIFIANFGISLVLIDILLKIFSV